MRWAGHCTFSDPCSMSVWEPTAIVHPEKAVTRHLSARTSHGKPGAAAITSSTEPRASRLMGLGASAYLVKPFQPQMFREKLEQVLEAVHG